MAKGFIFERRPSGSEKNEPKVIGKVLIEYFRSDSPLAKGYRKFLACNEQSAGKGGRQ